MCAQEVEEERRGGSRRHSVDVDQKRRLHYKSTTSIAKEMSESASDKQGQNYVPFGSDASARKYAESDSNPTSANSISVEIMSAHLVPSPIQVSQSDPKTINDNSSSPPPPTELKPLPSHLKYAYLDTEQQLMVIIVNNLHQEQEDKLLSVLKKHKKANWVEII
ncbi:hypothetical protein CR513_07196, partial [Mucuna pruriens]